VPEWDLKCSNSRYSDILRAHGIAPPLEREPGKKRTAPQDEIINLTSTFEDEGDAEEIEALEVSLVVFIFVDICLQWHLYLGTTS
jgi:hypothetical protein